MLSIERVKTISKLAVPTCIALSSSLTMTLIDLAMVGTLGNAATAALGLVVFSNALVLAFVGGLAPAVQGLVARRRGEGSTEPECLPLNAGLLVAVGVGAPLTLICYLFSPPFFSMISSDPEVTQIGAAFLRVLSTAIIAVGMNNAFNGYWAGMEKPKVNMLIALFMNCLNTFLNYLLIFGHFGAPALGATGAAIGTVVSLHAGVVINCALTYFRSLRFPKAGFLTAKPEPSLLARIIKLGLPATLNRFSFSAGYVIFFWLVGQVGTAELAAANVLDKVTMVLVILASSLGMASATLVGKSIGEGDLAGADRWGWDSAKLGVIVITLLGLPLFLFPRLFLSIFLTSPDTIAIAVMPLRIMAAWIGVASLIYIFAYTLYTVGDGNRVLIISFSTQWIFFLPAVWIVGPLLRYGLLQISLVQAAYIGIATAWVTAIWAGGRWKKITI
jgi:MATE family multidrug resistance protein